MKISPLKKVLNSLLEIKASHNEMNASAAEKLDEVILLIQHCIDNGYDDRNSQDKVIKMIGKFLDKMPSIIALIKHLSG